MGPILWLDVETTGLSQDRHGIVSLSVIADFDSQEVGSQTFYMNPVGREIEESALAVNGFTREQIAAFPDWIDVWRDFQGWLLATFTRAYVPVPTGGFNHVSFDARFIRSWASAAGGSTDEVLRIEDRLDVMKLVKGDTSGRFDSLPSKKLTAVAEFLGIALDVAHTADGDVRATREAFYKVKIMDATSPDESVAEAPT